MSKRCPRCEQTYGDHFNFCNTDGAPLVADPSATSPVRESTPVPSIPKGPRVADGNRWFRRPGEFAARFDAGDLSALLDKGIVVEEGTQGLLFQDGKMIGSLLPGRHTIETVVERVRNTVLKTPVSVVLVDISQTTIDVDLPELGTSDDQRVDGVVQLVLAVRHPVDFFLNVMKGQEVVHVESVAGRIRESVREVVEPFVLGCRADELRGGAELRERIELDLRHTLAPRVARLGLAVVGVDHVRFTGQTHNEILRRRGDLNREKAMAELDQAYRSFQAQLESESARQQMLQIKGDAEFSQFLKRLEHETFRRDLLRQQDRDDLSRQFHNRGKDQQSKGAHLLALLDLQRRTELARLAHDFDLDDLRREHERASESLRQRIELEEAARGQQQRRLDDELTEARAAISLYADYQSTKQKLAEAERRFEHELRNESDRARHQRELEKAVRFNELRPEALIALAPAEQAQLLANLRHTETLQGMDDSQILALFAKDSPEIARALAEKFKAAGGDAAQSQARQMYERLLADKDSMLQMFHAMHRDALKAQQDLAQAALRTPSETEMATPATIAPAPFPASIVTEGASPPRFVRPHGSAVCHLCNAVSPDGARFCPSCGTPFTT